MQSKIRRPLNHQSLDRAIQSCKKITGGIIAFSVLTSSISSCCFEDEPEKKGPKPGVWIEVNKPQGPTERRSESTPFNPGSGPKNSDRKEGTPDTPSPPATSKKQTTDGPPDSAEIMKGDKWCGTGMARIGRFCIDKWESELVSKKDKIVYPFYKIPPNDISGYMAHTAPGIYPQGYVSQETATKACANAGKRLCTLDEWQTACSSTGQKFPYGASFEEGKCNVNKTDPHILDLFFWKTPHLKRGGAMFNDECLLKIALDLPKEDPCIVKISESPNIVWAADGKLGLRFLEKTGTRTSCMTSNGVYDLVGNVSEWVSDTKEVPRDKKIHGVFAGEPMSSKHKSGCQHYTSAHSADYHDYSTGIRCCREMR